MFLDKFQLFLSALALSVLAVSCSSSSSPASDKTPIDKFHYEVKGVTLDMVEIPGDCYISGITPSLKTVEGETADFSVIDGYALSSTPITSELYHAVMGGSSDGRYIDRVSLQDAKKFALKLSKLTGVDFTVPSASQYEYAANHSSIDFDKKFKLWIDEPGSKDVARTPEDKFEYAPGTKAGGLGFMVAFQTNKPCSEAIVSYYNEPSARSDEERKTETITVGDQSFVMIKVPSVIFEMGGTPEDQGQYAKEDELPVHQVSLSDYEIGQTEVTAGLWNAVMGSVPPYNDLKRGADKPVVNVSWYEAKRFILKLNALTSRQFRLPTEAEWENAARGQKLSYRYSGSNYVGQVAVYAEKDIVDVARVKSKGPNALKIYDMSGNVWEWCQDYYGPYSEEMSLNPTGPSEGSGKVIRGGSAASRWSSCRVSNRDSLSPTNVKSTIGFRLAL